MRKKICRPMTDHAKELAVRRLAELRAAGDSPGDVLNQSTLNSWQSLNPLQRNQSPRKTPATQKVTGIDYQAEFGFAPGQNVGKL